MPPMSLLNYHRAVDFMFRRGIGRRHFLGLSAAALAIAVLGASKCATIATLALRNARLFTGTGAAPAPGQTIAIKGDRIIVIGDDRDVELGRDTEVIDCAGAFVMAGLIDTHVHVTEALIRREPLLSGWLRAGLTTLRDTGTIWQGPALLRSLAQELGPGPRIVATGGIVTVPNGYPTSRGPTGVAGSLQVATPEDAARGVNQTIDDGAQFIKIAVETGRPGGHLMEEYGEPTLSLEQVRAIAGAAHARGVTVSAHVTNEWELRRALDGGVDAIAHTPLDRIPADLLERMVAGRIPMTSTLNIWGSKPREAMENVRRFAAAGGIVAMGSDYPFQVHAGLPLGELSLMQEAGLTPGQVLVAATRNAATVAGPPDVGTVEPGKVADLIVVAGDPTKDVADLAKVSTVIQSGRRVT